MLALSTNIETLTGEVKTVQELIDDNDNYVYTCEDDGSIVPAKIEYGEIKTSNTIEIILDNGAKLICDENATFPIHNKGMKSIKDIKEDDIIVGCSFNRDSTLIYDHHTKIYIPSNYLANEKYDLYKELYEPRDILNLLPDPAGHVHEHLYIIASITITKKQLCNRLANDIFLKEMLKVDYLTYQEIETLINHFNLEYIDKQLSDDEVELMQLLQIKANHKTLEELVEIFKNGELKKYIDYEELTNDTISNAAKLVGYSNGDHLVSVRHLYGFTVKEIKNSVHKDVGVLTLSNGTNIGLTCGIFAGL